MPAPTLPKVSDVNGDMELQDLANLVGKVLKELNWLMTGNLDVENIRAKSITADRMNVNELSAITANLGHITAGLIEAVTIIGSLIKTAEFGQRVELSSTENLLKAVNQSGGTLNVAPNVNGSPTIVFQPPDSGVTVLYSTNSDFNLLSTTNINITASGAGRVRFSSWGNIYSMADQRTLQQELSALSARISALEAGSTPL